TVHGLHLLRGTAHEIFQPVNRVRADLLRRPGLPARQHLLARLPAEQDGVVLQARYICIRGFTLAEGVLEAGPHIAEVLDLPDAHDRERPGAIIEAKTAAANTGPSFFENHWQYSGHGVFSG